MRRRQYTFAVATIGVALFALLTLLPDMGALVPQRAMGQPGGPLETANPAGTPVPIDPSLNPSPNPSTPPAACLKTVVAGKCGTDDNLEPVSCGGETCFQTMIRYGQITNCATADNAPGLEDCCPKKCKKVVIKQSCVDSLCQLDVQQPQPTDVMDRTEACRELCPPPT